MQGIVGGIHCTELIAPKVRAHFLADHLASQADKDIHVQKVGGWVATGGDLHGCRAEEHFKCFDAQALGWIGVLAQTRVRILPNRHGVAIGEIHHLLLENKRPAVFRSRLAGFAGQELQRMRVGLRFEQIDGPTRRKRHQNK